MIEQVGDGVAVVGEVLVVGVADVLVDVFQLDEEQRDAVDEAQDVGPAAVGVARDPQLAHDQEMVVRRLLKVEDPKPQVLHGAIRPLHGHGHALPVEVVLLAVDLDERLDRAGLNDAADRLIVDVAVRPGLSFASAAAQFAGQHHLAIVAPAQGAVGTEQLVVVRVDRIPAEGVVEIGHGSGLHQAVFSHGAAHVTISPFISYRGCQRRRSQTGSELHRLLPRGLRPRRSLRCKIKIGGLRHPPKLYRLLPRGLRPRRSLGSNIKYGGHRPPASVEFRGSLACQIGFDRLE